MFRRRQLIQALVLGTAVAHSQTQPQPAAEPEDVGVLCRQDGSNYRALEMHNAVTSSDFDFFGGQLTYVTIPGRQSPCRYRSGEPVVFFLRVFLDLADPRAAFFPVKDPTRFALFSLQRDRDNRRLLLKDDGFTDTRRFAGAPLLARLHATSSFRMTPSDPLGAGEYAVKYTFPDEDRYRLFCFGVDSP